LLYAMGWETANVHLGSLRPEILSRNLKHKSQTWLLEAAVTMHDETLKDWKDWRKG